MSPVMHCWGIVKDLDDSQKLELISLLAESMRPVEHLRPFTMKEMDDLLDEAEAAFDSGDYLTNEEVFHPLSTLLPFGTAAVSRRKKPHR